MYIGFMKNIFKKLFARNTGGKDDPNIKEFLMEERDVLSQFIVNNITKLYEQNRDNKKELQTYIGTIDAIVRQTKYEVFTISSKIDKIERMVLANNKKPTTKRKRKTVKR
jgi:hypothetical protein